MKLLLLSNSVNPGAGYLDHAADHIRRHFEGMDRVLFLPFALHDKGRYTAKVRERFVSLGLSVDGLEEGNSAVRAVRGATGIFVGGGNTFRLLHLLQENGLIDPIREKTLGGTPYMGSSAGTVIAAPTLKTTNDMPIIQPASFDSLGLVPFQINCHYLDPEPESRHMGETRELRITEFLEENEIPVVGIREGAFLSVIGDGTGRMELTLDGTAGARIFRRGFEPVERIPVARLNDLLLPSQE